MSLNHIDGLIAEYGCVYIKTIKGVYGLKQAATISYNQIISHMEPHGYYPVPFKTGRWYQKTRITNFCLCVYDFGVKHFNKDDVDHPLESLKKER